MFNYFYKQIEYLEGDIAEVGVWKGKSAKILTQTFPGRVIHLFDTFEGMPDIANDYDNFHKKGDFADTSLEIVKENLKGCENVKFYKGMFPQTALAIEQKVFCLVNIDVDLFNSMKDCWEFFYSKLVKGGIFIIYDDYLCPNCEGATRATDEFLIDKPESLIKHDAMFYIIKE